VASKDATAPDALFTIHASWKKSGLAVLLTVHCDHLIQAEVGAVTDIGQGKNDKE